MKLKLMAFCVLFALATIPAFAEDAPEITKPTQESAEALSLELAELDTQEPEEQLDLENRGEFDVLTLLGLTSPLVEEGYRPGYCYHDCSSCETSADCKPPGSPYGFPCTSIPLC